MKTNLKYLAFDACECEYQRCQTLEEAREFLVFNATDEYENSINCDAKFSAIYELKEVLTLEEEANKKDYTDEEWEEEGYSLDHDTISVIKFKNVQETYSEQFLIDFTEYYFLKLEPGKIEDELKYFKTIWKRES